MWKNALPLNKALMALQGKHIILRFQFRRTSSILTADWSHLCRNRSERRTANLTTIKIRQMSVGTLGRMNANWDTLES